MPTEKSNQQVDMLDKLPSVDLLIDLLAQQGVNVDQEALTPAYDQAQQTLPSDVTLIEKLNYILVQAEVKNVRPVQLIWRRFDLRRLPALVAYQGEWYQAERVDSDQISLSGTNAQPLLVDEADMQDNELVWFRTPEQQGNFQAFNESGKKNRSARLVLRELFREPSWLVKVLVATLMVNTLAIATSIFAMQVYDRVVPTLAYATLTTLVAAMGLIILLDWSLKTIRARIIDSVAVTVDKRVSQQVFDHLLHIRLDMQPKSLGTLAAQVGGLDSVRQFFSSGIVFSLMDFPFALFFIMVIAVIGGKMAWVYCCLFVVALLLGFVTQFRLRKLIQQQLIRSNERQGVLVDAIRGAESIRSSNANWRFSQEWQNITASIDGYNIQQKAINSISTVTTTSLSTLAYVSAVVVGVFQIEAGLLTMGGLIACSILGGRVIAPIAQAVQYIAQYQNVHQSLKMVDQVLSLDLERRPDQNLLLPEELPESITLDKIRFAYPNSPIQQLNIPHLSFKSGERVLLVGPVGCGKSTLLKVMSGLYRPSEGRVRLGNADLWEMDPQAVANQLGYLSQTIHLFKGTLRSNLALSGSSTDSRMLKITHDLGIDAIAADNPLGMDLVISEGGDGLSGGQKQLVSLARVLINQPRIWLLDEPTASLDSRREAEVWKVLEENVRPEDILIVSTHRPMQAMKLATRVVVMQEGEIIHDGKPEAVMPNLVKKPTNQRSDYGVAGRSGGKHNVI